MSINSTSSSFGFVGERLRFASFGLALVVGLVLTGCGGGSSGDANLVAGAAAIRDTSAASGLALDGKSEKATGVSGFDVTSAIKVADENQQFTLIAPGTVYYGANGAFVALQLAAGAYWANNGLFGDPVPGAGKAAYVIGTASIAVFDPTKAVKIAGEATLFTLTTSTIVFYGANGSFTSRQLAPGSYIADNSVFGDPIPGVGKAAYVSGTDPAAVFDPTTGIKIAAEGAQFKLTASAVVFYGANGSYASRQLPAGTYNAGNPLFGDPIPGVGKAAYVLASSAVALFDVTTATKVANEGGQFTLVAAGNVYFGANGSFVAKQMAAGSYVANAAAFGSDPAPGAGKAAYVVGTTMVAAFDIASATKVASEDDAFTVNTATTVFFYGNGNYTSLQLSPGNYKASVALFGDPAPGSSKAAYVMEASAVTVFDPSTGIRIAADGEPFYLSAPALVYFGARSSFTSKQLAAGTYYATTTLFGDPISGVAKAAYVVGDASLPIFDPATANKIANENQQFVLPYQSLVFFVAGSSYTSRLLPAGTYYANQSIFADPSPGVGKTAYVSTLDYGPRATAPPTIVSQPQSVAVTSGTPVMFGITAASNAILSYQWTRDGNVIPNATTSTYALPATLLADTGARFAVTVSNNFGSTSSTVAFLTVNASAGQQATAQRPFSDQSLWNSRPTRVTFGTFVLPASYYPPDVAEGAYSVGAFAASASDPAVVVMGAAAGHGVFVPDAEAYVNQLTIPRWPANVVVPTGGDGHADIIDVPGNKIHSFYQLRKDGTQWRAAQYTWTTLDGRGWGTPAQYFSGSRAAGVVPIAGLIRTFEMSDGLAAYKHALAMSLPRSGLSPSPAYTFPATAADIYADADNSGAIPEGALMMLPPGFDLTKIKDPKLLKIARTLQSYGAYVVDANGGSPFLIYAELGSGFNLMPNGQDDEISAELELIRSALRQAVTTSGWVDANGASFVPETKLNILSLRGAWYVMRGPTAGTFDTWDQAVTFPANGQYTVQINTSGRSLAPSLWATPQPGNSYRLQVTATGGATFQFSFIDGSGNTVTGSPELGNGGVYVFNWPNTSIIPTVRVASGVSGGGKVWATLIAQ